MGHEGEMMGDLSWGGEIRGTRDLIRRYKKEEIRESDLGAKMGWE